jgi:hypothetical protein
VTKIKWNSLLLAAMITPFVVGLSSLFNSFGFLDDYVFLQNVKNDKDALTNLLVSAGRPLNAWAYDVSYTFAGTVENLVVLRFASITLMSIFAGLLFLVLKDLRLPQPLSLAITVLVAASNSFSLFASWAQHWTTSLTLVCVGLCAYWMNRDISKGASVVRMISVASMLAAAALMYLPAALLYPILSTLRFVLNRTNFRSFFSETLIASGVILLTAFVSLQIGQQQFPSEAARFQLSGDVITKTLWFLRFPLFQALTPWSVSPNAWDALLLIGFASALLVYWKKTWQKSDLKKVLAVLACVLIVSSPNLLTSENWASYRSTVALNSLALIFGTLAVWRVFSRHQESRPRVLGRKTQIMGVTFVVCIAVAKGVFTTGLIVQPNSIEYRNLVLETNLKEVDCAVIQTSSWADSKFRPQAYDEFGIYSGSVPIVAKSMAALALDLDLTKVSTQEEYLRGDVSCRSKILLDFRTMMEQKK